ncbi:MAG TPA: VWA domain-containing protein [Verrucomicrobiae bacterium]|jgi:Ca-activated chloride channel family protein|nr:VWA domain-containing protein [Verrucomicrobiae bacterium]
MKTILFTLGLATTFTANLFARETLNLKLVPERDLILKNQPQEVVVKIDLSAIGGKEKIHRPPLNLAVVLDKSGSMTGAKLEKTKQAAMQLVDRLAPDDIFSLVIFSDEAEILVPAQHVEDKEALKEKIEGIKANGSTALYAGVKLGAEQLEDNFSSKRINRVILLSDGLANVGPSSPRQLRRLGGDLTERGISVTTIGVGDDYNEDLMAGLAEASDANYYYVQDTEKLSEIFARELGELRGVVARDVRIEVICPEDVKPLGFIGRAEKFENQKAVVNLSQFTGGQDRYLLLRCLVNGDTSEIAQVNADYKDEFDDDSEQTISGTAKIDFTGSQKLSDESANDAVVAEKELMLTAVAKDEAMAQADAGNYLEAGKILNAQNATLYRVMAAAPASVQDQIRAETKYLQTFGGAIENGQYDSATRKTMQSQSYNARNSK